MLISLFPSISPLVICCSVVLAVGIACLLRHVLMRQNEDEISHAGTGKISRRLGSFERYFSIIASGYSTCYLNTVLLLESKVKLDPGHLKTALLMLSERFALLRMRITVDNVFQQCFEEMEDPQSLEFQTRMDIDSENWLSAFNEHINFAPFNTEKGPLWRVTLLRETTESEGEGILYKNALLFTFHHIICDARSVFEFKNKLLQFLGSLYNGKAMKVETLAFRPTLERMTLNLTKPNILERLLIPLLVGCSKLSAMIRKPKMANLYLLKFPPNVRDSLAQTTHAIPRCLTKEQTMALVSCCKANGCTVHGAITAATHLAMKQIIEPEQTEQKPPLLFDSNYTVDIRQQCEPKLGREEFGLYATFDALQIEVKGTEEFWDFSRTCTNKVHRKIDSGEHMNFLKLIQCVNLPSLWNLFCSETKHGQRKELFNLTNLGVLSIDQEGKSPYKFAGAYFAVQSAKFPFITGNEIFTINDQLYWTVEYSPEIITRSRAQDFVDLSLRILMDACIS